jgi:phasin
MNNNPKYKPEEQVRRTTERVADVSKEGLDRITTATSEAAETMRDYCSKAAKGAQDYHNRVLEFAQMNANSSFELAQRLLNAKSPSEFFEVSSDHMRRQWEMIADQTKQLTVLAQNATAASAEPLKSGFEKVFNRAA